MIIGAAMMLMSVFIDVNKLAIFVFAGALLVLFGFFKIIIKVKKAAPHHKHHAAHPHAKHHKPKVTRHHTAGAHMTPKTKAHHKQSAYCSNCGVKLHPLFHFCPNCGQKMK
jgi:predicted RNA-binding Zn-ribbon protein involved in translation (DUF1610 family)